MKKADTYFSLAEPSEGLYKVKGSKHFAYAFPVHSEEEVKEKLEELKKLHPSARHHCYAYRLGLKGDIYRANDAGEPSNSAGKPILGQITAHDLSNLLIVVVRYFGGTKLGVGGLMSAYKTAALEAIENGKIVEKHLLAFFRLKFGYDLMPSVMNLIKKHQIKPLSQDFSPLCELKYAIRQGEAEELKNQLEKLGVKEIEFLGLK